MKSAKNPKIRAGADAEHGGKMNIYLYSPSITLLCLFVFLDKRTKRQKDTLLCVIPFCLFIRSLRQRQMGKSLSSELFLCTQGGHTNGHAPRGEPVERCVLATSRLHEQRRTNASARAPASNNGLDRSQLPTT